MTNAERCREYYKKHREKLLAYQKAYRKAHPEKIKKRKQEYNATHREEINAYWREYHSKHKLRKKERTEEYKKKYPEKIKARYTLNNAIKRGEIKRQPCEVCGGAKAEAHHDNYDKPLEIKWLCPKCHAEYHKSMGYTIKEYEKGD